MKFPLLSLLLILTGCASGAPPRTYMLGAPADPAAGVHADGHRPIVEFRTVSVPDHLDTTDISWRDGRNELKISGAGRWGERLSYGIRDALNEALTRRLPDIQVTRTVLSSQSARGLLVDVEAFDCRPDGRCVLTAYWAVLRDDRRTIETTERGTFIAEASPGSTKPASDAIIVASMADAVEQLADRVAITLRRVIARSR